MTLPFSVVPKTAAFLLDVAQVGGLDDEGVAFPMAARIAQPLLDPAVDVRAAVHRNDARVVNHLHQDHDVAGRLKDLVVVIVEARHHRAGQAAGDAAFVGAAILGRIGRADLSGLGQLRRELLCLGRQRR